MANRKLDMGRAWTLTTGLIGANRDTIGAIAGLFFFLPSLVASIFVPALANPPAPAGPSGADPDAAMQALTAQMSAMYADNWPLLTAMLVIQFIGSMSLLALLSDRGNPTVGEALGTGIRSIPAYLLAQIVSVLGAGLAIGLPAGLLAAAGNPALIAVGVIVTIVAVIYLFAKFALLAPVIAIEGERNPIAALRRSWRLTKGNSLRILVFLFLLMFTIGLIATLVSAVLTLILSAIGEPVTTIGINVVSALVNAVITVVFLVVTAAIHRQLAGPSQEAVAETFA
ncbi:glycerophosphoryl diester phosphodiesterase membrane domain-containing protein [Erythrobacter sp. WG]|uniref:glycerophosphoryl diester phosphodiesterase membrane domain-containing protein n=1 Tax=Erythrobacter sp. WG TaxID=2985510 RepID=UPI00226EBF20|nr:glycerophosphoryl diester phosphodiesterase membrane domain-containing protein [Erythrobacter sp. WG]MCX9148656.1 glycerophosphoryl diester phosphodiesterase membrane domain-containing protein [Erythrobacter sp. WG]